MAWWVVVGAGAGAIAGFLVGGIGGRLGMLLLRLTSPEIVIGVTSDDGFEIGVVSVRSFQLLFGTAMLGAANGVVYAALRRAIPRRLRLPLWTLLATAAGGAAFVHEDGIDFALLEPAALAVALFVALPGLAAALVVVLVERWIDRDPATDRRLAATLLAAALAGTFAVIVAAGVGGIALAVRRAGLTVIATRVARVVVPVGLVAFTLYAGIDLVTEAARIV